MNDYLSYFGSLRLDYKTVFVEGNRCRNVGLWSCQGVTTKCVEEPWDSSEDERRKYLDRWRTVELGANGTARGPVHLALTYRRVVRPIALPQGRAMDEKNNPRWLKCSCGQPPEWTKYQNFIEAMCITPIASSLKLLAFQQLRKTIIADARISETNDRSSVDSPLTTGCMNWLT